MSESESTDQVIGVVGVALDIAFLPLPSDDPKVRRPDITRARTLLGWEPLVELHEGIERMVASLR